MSIFDWVPTLDEVIDWTQCRIMGHEWVTRRRGGSPVEADSTELVTYCEVCGKEK